MHFNKEITVEIRNGDTTSYEKKKQLAKPPNILITTPESLSLLLSNKESNNLFKELSTIIIDEWHELMGSKRGNQCELSLSWLRGNVKNLQIWAMSATIGNIEEAARAIVGMSAIKPKIISTNIEKERIKNCWSYRNLRDQDWNWCLDFLEYGGKCLKAYPKYKKLSLIHISEPTRR